MKTGIVRGLCVSAVGAATLVSASAHAADPSDVIDLSYWNITLPMDADGDEKVDTIKVSDIQDFTHPDYFYVNEAGHVVFATPNKAFTTPNSSNTRSELRHMIRGTNTRIKTKGFGNNMGLPSHPNADELGAVGGTLSATLAVNHVATRAQFPDKYPAFSVVIGQIHAGKDDNPVNGFGAGNEPLKIYYKKWPGHETGSVFWTYERNLERDDPLRKDIAYPVWGYTWDELQDPGENGVALDEFFSYQVHVEGDVMHLTFESPNHETVTYAVNLADNTDPYGNIDEADHPQGYAGDWMYFKAGAYNQCSTATYPGFWYAGCLGTGVWETDQANGDYAQVTFSKLDVAIPE